MTTRFAADVLKFIVDAIEIPESHYQRATARYQSLGDWLQRRASKLATFDPRLYSQGSFRLGTAVRPVDRSEGYDLDLVCELVDLSKPEATQSRVKTDVGEEVTAYAAAHAMSEPKEGRRCWHLDYSDDVHFHLDVLPAIPEDERTKQRLAEILAGLRPSPELAYYSVAITDNTDPAYNSTSNHWPMSNPRGYGAWFDDRMFAVALPRLRSLVDSSSYASVDEVPAYAWKTPLQRAIQVMKRHRDVMFRADPRRKPISVIISTLAARAFEDQTSELESLDSIVNALPGLIRPRAPRVPNPVNPGEDFADKWSQNPERRLEQAFRDWVIQLRADLDLLRQGMNSSKLRVFLQTRFAIDVPDDQLRELARTVPAVAAAPAVQIQNPAPPHGSHPV